MSVKLGEYTGHSDSGISAAVENALKKANQQHTRFEIIEARGSYLGENKSCYQVTLSIFLD